MSPREWQAARYAGRPVDGERVTAYAACAPCVGCGAELGDVEGGYLVVALRPESAELVSQVEAAAGARVELVRRAWAPGGWAVCWGCVLRALGRAEGDHGG